MTRFSILFLITLPFCVKGQGYILIDSVILNNFPEFSQIDYIDSYSDRSSNGFVLTTTDSVYRFEYDENEFKKYNILTSSKPYDFEFSSVQIINEFVTEYNYNDSFIVYDKTSGSIKEVKKVKENRHKSIEYSFQDEKYLYLISYYNRELKDNSKSHDLVYFYKLSKKNFKLVKSKAFDIGTEIILAPFNHQLISFNEDFFLIADRIGHRVLKISRDLKLCDTLYLNPTLGKSNLDMFTNAFPKQNVKHYLHKPKMVIDHYTSSDFTKNLTTIFKIFFLNDSTLAIVYKSGTGPNEIFDLEVRNINTLDIIYKKKISKENDLRPLTWTPRIYATSNGNFMTISLGKEESALKYIAKLWTFSSQKAINIDSLAKILDINFTNTISYSGVILTDEYFCKGCYGSGGTGKGVLVITKSPNVKPEILDAVCEKQKRQWNINGDLLFVDSAIYNKLRESIPLNYLTPISNN